MPTYGYHCTQCGASFERQEHVSEHGTQRPSCPKCHSDRVQQQMTPFYARTARKT